MQTSSDRVYSQNRQGTRGQGRRETSPTTGDTGNNDGPVEEHCWNQPWMTRGQTAAEEKAGPGRQNQVRHRELRSVS